MIDIGGKIISRKASKLAIQADRILANKESKKAKNYIKSSKVDFYFVRSKFLSSKNKYWEKKRKHELKNIFEKVKDTNDKNFLSSFVHDDVAKEVGFNMNWIFNRIKKDPHKIKNYFLYNISFIKYYIENNWIEPHEIQILNKMLYVYFCNSISDFNVLGFIKFLEENKFPFDEKNLKKIETIKVFC